MTTKKCVICGIEKPLTDFYKDSTRKDGLQYRCKKCTLHNAKKHYIKNKDKIITKQRVINIKSKYKITVQEYEDMFNKQNGKCSICGSKNIGRKGAKYFNIDHCHATGKVRGLLCHNCNIILGKLNDDIDMCRKIISYLSF